MVTGEYIKEFIYKEDIIDKTILHTKVTDLECKHVVSLLASDVYNASKKAGYQNVVLGSHRNGTLESESKIIEDMQKDVMFNRPIRVILAKDNRLWCDNTHSAIAYVKRFGTNITIEEIPFYLVDIRAEIPIVISVNKSILPNVEHIKNAIACSLRINQRIDLGVRPRNMHWNINDLMNDLDSLLLLTT